MAQNPDEITKDMVVALIGQIEGLSFGALKINSKELGKAIAEVYREVFNEVKKP